MNERQYPYRVFVGFKEAFNLARVVKRPTHFLLADPLSRHTLKSVGSVRKLRHALRLSLASVRVMRCRCQYFDTCNDARNSTG